MQQFYDVNFLLTSFSYKSPVKFGQSFWIRFLDRKFENPANICAERFLSFLPVIFICGSIPLVKSLVIKCTPRNCHGVCNESESSRMVVSW